MMRDSGLRRDTDCPAAASPRPERPYRNGVERRRQCCHRIKLTFGSTTSVGSSYIYFGLPAPYNALPIASSGNTALFQDNGTNFIGSVIVLAGNAQLICFYGNATASSRVPITWGAGDVIELGVLIIGP
jgi:hypothetical protein